MRRSREPMGEAAANVRIENVGRNHIVIADVGI